MSSKADLTNETKCVLCGFTDRHDELCDRNPEKGQPIEYQLARVACAIPVPRGFGQSVDGTDGSRVGTNVATVEEWRQFFVTFLSQVALFENSDKWATWPREPGILGSEEPELEMREHSPIGKVSRIPDSTEATFREAPTEYNEPFSDGMIQQMVEDRWHQTGGSLTVCRLLVTILQKSDEIERLRFWLDVATNKGNIPDHAADAEDRAWAAASCQYSFAHLPSDDVRDRLTEEYREAVEAEARDNG